MVSNYEIIGICSLCGGNVVVWSGPYWSIIPPTPFCQRCGAREAKHLPIIDMEPIRKYRYKYYTTYDTKDHYRYDQ